MLRKTCHVYRNLFLIDVDILVFNSRFNDYLDHTEK